MVTQNLVGQNLGQYELRELIGIGGMGAVYRAHQANLKREVAIKVLPPTFALEAGYVERFTLEAETAAALEHPHIVPILDYGTQRGTSYVVMRLLTGGTLAERLRERAGDRHPLPSLGEIAELLRQLASALDYAHNQRVIHRDIKTSNVMFDNQGNSYLVDFGIAKLLGTASGLTGTGMTMGTPAYMSPEQWSNQELTPAIDQYALGVLVYALIAGRVPFEAPTPFQLMHKHLHDMPTPPQSFRTGVPDAVTAVLQRSLAKQPQDRFRSVMAFAQAFAGAIEGIKEESTDFFTFKLRARRPQLVTGTPSEKYVSGSKPVTLPGRPAYKNPLIWVVGVAIMALLVILGVLLAPPDNEAETLRKTLTAIAGTPTATETPTEEPTVTLIPSDTPEAPTVTLVPSNTPEYSATSTADAAAGQTATAQFEQELETQLAERLTDTAAAWTDTPTVTRTRTPTATRTPTRTQTPTITPSWTPTITPSSTQTPSATPSWTPTITPSSTQTPSITPSRTPTHTPTRTPSRTPTPTNTPTEAAPETAAAVVIPPDGELVIGVAAALSGEGLTPLGEDIKRGAELVNLNRPTVKIGDAEFKVKLDVQDDVCSAEGGQAVANRYVSDKRIVAVVGPMCSSACRAAGAIFDEAGYTSISPSCTGPDLTNGDIASFNRFVPTDAAQGVIDAEFVYNVLGVRRIATIHDGSPYGEGLVAVITEKFTGLGGEVVAADAVNVGDTDFRGLLDTVAAADPELVYFVGFIAEGVRLVNQRLDVGLDKALFMGADGIFADAFITDAGGAAEGIYASSPQPGSEIYDAFRQQYIDEFGFEPTGPYHANSADALNVIMDAIEKVGAVDANGDLVVDRMALREAIRATKNYQGLIGEINCDETGECATTAINIYRVKDGKWVLAQSFVQTVSVTSTPTPTLTPVAPNILTFTANTTIATVDQVINLSWQAEADDARIELLSAQNQVIQTFSVTPTGTLPVTIPTGQGTLVVYRLVVARNQVEVSTSIPITVSCPIAWFFGNEYANQPGTGCPTGSATLGGGAYQQFEKGVAIYIENMNSAKKVYGLQQSGQFYLGYTSGWDGTTIYDSSTCGGLSPTAPLLFPAGAFGWMYCSTSGSGGTWNTQLGWATLGIDGTQRAYQTSDTGVIFVDVPGGGVYRFSGGDSGTWLKVKGPTAPPPTARTLVGVNVRSGPGTSFNPPIGSLPASTDAEILAKNPAGDWYKIVFWNGEGWVSAQTVSVTSDTSMIPVDAGPPTPAPTAPLPPTATPIPTSNANLRIVNVTIAPHPFVCGQSSSIQVTIVNDGSEGFAEGGIIRVDDLLTSTGANLGSTEGIFPGLRAGQSYTAQMYLRIDANVNRRHNTVTTVDATNRVFESNEGDNQSSIPYVLAKGDCP